MVLVLMGTRMHDIKRILNVSNEAMNSSENILVEFGIRRYNESVRSLHVGTS